MRNIISVFLTAGLLLGGLGHGVRGNDTVAPPDAGRVLILENDRTMTGDIERVGVQYRIKRLIGETWIPAESVVKLCASLDEAYQFLRRRANLNDADERLRLADWCRQHGLRDAALAEAQEALKLRPEERVRRLVAHLQEARAREAKPTTPTTAEPESPRIEVTAESLGMFASKVQPILMNACVNCHAGGRGGSFQLSRVSTPGLASRRSTEKNLAAVLAQLNARDSGPAKFLLKAISVHGPGMTQAPLKGREATAFRLLEQWALRTAESQPAPRDVAHASVTAPPARGEEGWGKDRDAKPQAPPTPPPAPAKEPVKRPESVDPVDPEGFNREFHPTRSNPPTPPPGNERPGK